MSKKKQVVRCFVILFMVVLLSKPMTAYAYEPWVTVPETAVADGSGEEPASTTTWGITAHGGDMTRMQPENGGEPSKFDEMMANFFHVFAHAINRILSNDETEYDLRIDNLIGGEIARFTLNDNNNFGLAGAHIYVSLRGVVFGLFFVYAAWLLLQHAFKSSAKGMVELKEGIVTLVFAFLMIYLFPQIVQAAIALQVVLRNIMIHHIGSMTIDVNAIYNAVDEIFKTEIKSTPVALVLIGYAAAPFFFLISYVTIAFTEAILFGFYPVICLLGLKNKKLMSNYYGTFFSNLAIPIIDSALMLIPVLIFQNAGLSETNFKDKTGIFVIVLVCIWSIIPARTGLLRVLGNAGGMTGVGAGMGALMAMARMARAGRGGKESSGGDRDLSDAEKAEFHQRNADMEAAGYNSGIELNGASGEPGVSSGGDTMMMSDGFEESGHGFMDEDVSSGSGTDDEGRGEVPGYETDSGSDYGSGGDVDIDEADIDAGGTTSMDDNTVEIEGTPNVDADIDTMPVSDGIDTSVQEPLQVSSSEGIEPISEDMAPVGMGSMNGVSGDPASNLSSVDDAPRDLRAENLSAMDQARADQINAQNEIANGDAHIAEMQASLPELQNSADNAKAEFDRVSKEEMHQQTGIQNQIDGNTSRIQSLQRENSEMGAKLGAPGGSISAEEKTVLRGNMRANNEKISRLQSVNAELETQKTASQARVSAAASANEAASQRLTSMRGAIATEQANVAQAKANLNNANQRLNNAQQREANFASASSAMGGPETTYSSRQQYDHAQYHSDVMMGKRDVNGTPITDAHKQRENALVNHRNFDTKTIASTTNLTEQEKADFYKQRARRDVYSRFGTGVAKGVAGTIGATVGASAMMFGGPQAMFVGGSLGAGAGSKAVDAAKATPGVVRDVAMVADHAKEKLNGPMMQEAKRDIGNVAQKAAKGVRKKFNWDNSAPAQTPLEQSVASVDQRPLRNNVTEGVVSLNEVTDGILKNRGTDGAPKDSKPT